MREGFYSGDSGLEDGGLDEFECALSDVFIFDDEPGVEGVDFCLFGEAAACGFKCYGRVHFLFCVICIYWGK